MLIFFGKLKKILFLFLFYHTLPEIIDEEAGPNKVVEALHDGTGEEQHELPLLDEDHLALDVKCFVHILKHI